MYLNKHQIFNKYKLEEMSKDMTWNLNSKYKSYPNFPKLDSNINPNVNPHPNPNHYYIYLVGRQIDKFFIGFLKLFLNFYFIFKRAEKFKLAWSYL